MVVSEIRKGKNRQMACPDIPRLPLDRGVSVLYGVLVIRKPAVLTRMRMKMKMPKLLLQLCCNSNISHSGPTTSPFSPSTAPRGALFYSIF